MTSPRLPNIAIEPLILLRHMEVPEGVPLAVEVGGSEVQHRLGAARQPAHPRPLHAILDQMPTRSLDYSTADRITRRQVFVVLHPIPIPLEILRRILHGFPLLSLQTTLGGLVAYPTDHRVHFPLQQPLETFFHPLMRLALLGLLLKETPGHLPQPFHDMKQIQDTDRVLREILALPVMQRPLPIREEDHGLAPLRIAADHLIRQPEEQRHLAHQQFRTHPFVLWTGATLTGLLPHHFLDHIVGLAHERLDRINRTHRRHLLLVRLLALATTLVRQGWEWGVGRLVRPW